MKRLATTICAAAAVICSATAMASDFGVVNMEMIFKDSPQVKMINTNLQKKFSGQKDAIMKQGKMLQTNLQKYNKNKSVMSAADTKKLATTIAKEETGLRAAQAKFQQALFAAQNKAMKGFMTTVDAAVAKVAKANKMDIVLPKNGVVYSKKGMDITKTVMSDMK
jgi:outer membrane protein